MVDGDLWSKYRVQVNAPRRQDSHCGMIQFSGAPTCLGRRSPFLLFYLHRKLVTIKRSFALEALYHGHFLWSPSVASNQQEKFSPNI